MSLYVTCHIVPEFSITMEGFAFESRDVRVLLQRL